jgi:hypothetical protein
LGRQIAIWGAEKVAGDVRGVAANMMEKLGVRGTSSDQFCFVALVELELKT